MCKFLVTLKTLTATGKRKTVKETVTLIVIPPPHPTPRGRGGGDSRTPPAGVLASVATKVGYFGVKSANVSQGQMGTKHAKVGRLAQLSAQVRRFCATKTPPTLCGRTKVAIC